MIYKVILKSFKQNFKNYILYFLCSILSITMIFCFSYIEEFMSYLSTIGLRYIFNNLKGIYDMYFVLIGIITIVFMNFSMKYYIKTRFKDYSIFLMLGIKRNMLRLVVALEYLTICLLSLIIGLVMGNILVFVLGLILKTCKVNFSIPLDYVINVYFNSIIISLVLFLVQMSTIWISLSTRNLSQLAVKNISKQKNYDKYGLLAIVGFIVITKAIYNVIHEFTMETFLSSIILFVLSMYFIISSGGNFYLNIIKKFGNYYYKNLLSLNTFTHFFKTNNKIIFISFVINFLIMFVLNLSILSSVDSINAINNNIDNCNDYDYPYDCVFVIDEENKNEIDSFKQEFNTTSIDIAIIKLHLERTVDNQLLYALPVSYYNEIMNKNLQLNLNEIFFVSQHSDDWGSFDGYETIRIKLKDKSQEFKIINSIPEIVFGNRLSNELRDIAIVSDEIISEFKTTNSDFIYLQTFSNENKELVDSSIRKMKKYNPNAPIFYKDLILEEEKLIHIFMIIACGFAGIFSIICFLCILYIKLFSDVDELTNKYKLLKYTGIKSMRKNLNKEFKLLFFPSIILSIISSNIFFLVTMRENFNDMGFYDVINRFMIPISFFFILIIINVIIQIIYYFCVRNKITKIIENNLHTTN